MDVLSLIGNTPLLRLNRIGREHPGVEIYAKAEWFNPGSSVKDRPALNIIREAERAGLMCRQRVLIDSTSGNTGIAYAMICAARGYRLKLFMPSNVSSERKRILHAYGTEVVYTDPLEGSDGAIRAVRDLVRHKASQYFYANQYDNPANWQAHYHSTGPGNLRANRRESDAFRGRPWHQRDLYRHDAKTQRAQSGHPMHFGAAGLVLSWSGGA